MVALMRKVVCVRKTGAVECGEGRARGWEMSGNSVRSQMKCRAPKAPSYVEEANKGKCAVFKGNKRRNGHKAEALGRGYELPCAAAVDIHHVCAGVEEGPHGGAATQSHSPTFTHVVINNGLMRSVPIYFSYKDTFNKFLKVFKITIYYVY